MVYVRLEQEWTDSAGNTHQAGEMVDVDAATLAELEAGGIVEEPDGGWPAPTGGGGGTDGGWPAPTGGGGTDGGWPAPTGGGGGTDGGWPAPTSDDDS
jgi:hypothetical protein